MTYSLHDTSGAELARVECPVDAHRLLRTLDDAETWRLPTGEVGGVKLPVRKHRRVQR